MWPDPLVSIKFRMGHEASVMGAIGERLTFAARPTALTRSSLCVVL